MSEEQPAWMQVGEGETPGEGVVAAEPGHDEPGFDRADEQPLDAAAAEEKEDVREEAGTPPPALVAPHAGAPQDDEDVPAPPPADADADVPPPPAPDAAAEDAPPPPAPEADEEPPPPPVDADAEGEGEGAAAGGEGGGNADEGPGGVPLAVPAGAAQAAAGDDNAHAEGPGEGPGEGPAGGAGAEVEAEPEAEPEAADEPVPSAGDRLAGLAGSARAGADSLLGRFGFGAAAAEEEKAPAGASDAEIRAGVLGALGFLVDRVVEDFEDAADEVSHSEVSEVIDGMIVELEKEEKQSLNQLRDGDEDAAAAEEPGLDAAAPGEGDDAAAAPGEGDDAAESRSARERAAADAAAAAAASKAAAAAAAAAMALRGAPGAAEDDDDASSGSEDDVHEEIEREEQAAADERRQHVRQQKDERRAAQAARREAVLRRWAPLEPRHRRAVTSAWGFENRARALYATSLDGLGPDRLHDLVGNARWQELWALWKDGGASSDAAVVASLDVMDALENAADHARPGFALPAAIQTAVAGLADALGAVDADVVGVLDENADVVAAMEELLTGVQLAVAEEEYERRAVESTVRDLVGAVDAMSGMLGAIESGAVDAVYSGPPLELDMSLFSPGFEARWEADAERRRQGVAAPADPAVAAALFGGVAAAAADEEDRADAGRRVRFGSDQVRLLDDDGAEGAEGVYEDDEEEKHAPAAAEPVLPVLETSVAESEASSVDSELVREEARQQRRRQRLSTIETLFSKDALTNKLEAERPPAYALFPDYFKRKMEAEPSEMVSEISSFKSESDGASDDDDNEAASDDDGAAGSLHELFENLGIPEEYADNFDQQDIFMSDLHTLSAKALAALLPNREGRRKLERWMKREEANLDYRLKKARKEARRMGQSQVPDTLDELFSQLKIPARFLDLWDREQVYMSDLAGLKKSQLRRLLPAKGPRTRLKAFVKSNMAALRARRAELVTKESQARVQAKVIAEDDYVRWLENQGVKRQIAREQSEKLEEDALALDAGEDYLAQYHRAAPRQSPGQIRAAADELINDLKRRSGKRSVDRLDAAHRLAERGESSVEELMYLTASKAGARRDINPYVDELESLRREAGDVDEYTFSGPGLPEYNPQEEAAAGGRGTCQTAGECTIS